MNAKFGKREQAAALGLGSLVVIGVLHTFVFGPKAAAFSQAYEDRKSAQTEAEYVKLLKHESELVQFEKETAKIGEGYQRIVKSLHVDKNKAFNTVSIEDIKVEVSPKMRPEEVERARQAAFEKEKKKARDIQIDMVYALFDQLRAYAPGASDSIAGYTKMPFLAFNGTWRLPQKLKDDIRGAELEDIIREARDIQALLRMIDDETLRQRQQNLYERELGNLGIREAYYQDVSQRGLAGQGEYVALVHKMWTAQLLERALESGERRYGEELTREDIYSLLGLAAPDMPLINSRNGEDLGISELYLLYEEIGFVVRMLEAAVHNGVVEVGRVTLGEPSYLLARVDNKYPWHREDYDEPTPPDVVGSPYTLVGFERIEPIQIKVNPPGDNELGYALPVVVDFRANNVAGWAFIYEVLRVHPMAEIDELQVRFIDERQLESIPGSEPGELAWKVKFLHIPMLFAADRSSLARAAAKKKAREKFDGTLAARETAKLVELRKRVGNIKGKIDAYGK